jgi:voltage-gated potassium channel
MMRKAGKHARLKKFISDVSMHTPFSKMVVLLILLWIGFSAAIYLAEQGVAGSSIESYGNALYWGIAAFSTAGIADAPVSGSAQLIGGIWIVLGSVLFFGTIVATVTTYFMRPMQGPHNKDNRYHRIQSRTAGRPVHRRTRFAQGNGRYFDRACRTIKADSQ